MPAHHIYNLVHEIQRISTELLQVWLLLQDLEHEGGFISADRECNLELSPQSHAEVMRHDSQGQAKLSNATLKLQVWRSLQPGLHISLGLSRDESVPAPHTVLVGAAVEELLPHGPQAGQHADALSKHVSIAHRSELHDEVKGFTNQLQLMVEPLLGRRQRRLAFTRLQEPLPQLAELAS